MANPFLSKNGIYNGTNSSSVSTRPASGASTRASGLDHPATDSVPAPRGRWFSDINEVGAANLADDPKSLLLRYLQAKGQYSYAYAQEMSKFNPYNIALIMNGQMPSDNYDKIGQATDVWNTLRGAGKGAPNRIDVNQLRRNLQTASYDPKATTQDSQSLAWLIDNAQDMSPETSAGTFTELVLSALQGLVPTEGLNAMQLFLNARSAEYVAEMATVEGGNRASFHDWLQTHYGYDMGF